MDGRRPDHPTRGPGDERQLLFQYADLFAFMSDESLFATDSMSPSVLRSILRTASRPLTRAQISSLYGLVKTLNNSGFASAWQILEELNPATENIAGAVFNGSSSIEYGAIPALHLPLNATFVSVKRDDFMATMNIEDAQDEATVVPWNTNDHMRLAIWTAMSRAKGGQSSELLLPHAASLISMADGSERLHKEDLKRFFFAEAVTPLDCSQHQPDVATGLLLQICDLAIKYLSPRRKEHAEIVAAYVEKLSREEAFNGDYFRCISKLAPFMNDDTACETADKCLWVLEQADPPTYVRHLIVEALTVMVATLSPSSRPWNVIGNHVQGVINAAARSEASAENSDNAGDGDAVCFRLVQTVLQQISGQGSAEARKRLVDLDVTDLVEAESTSSSKDSALVAAIHAHPALALSISKELLALISEDGVATNAQIKALPCTLLTLLSTLVEERSAKLGGQTWTEAHLKPIVHVGIGVVLRSSDDSSNRLLNHAACLVAALHCASIFGWEDTQADAASSLLKFAKDAGASSPQVAFRGPLFQILLGLVQEVPKFPELSEILQATVDASLLWLVRRFAEDENDSTVLVQAISAFTALIEAVTATSSIQIQLKKSLVDPVVQAAIKNRLRALEQMQLVRALCTHGELESTHLSRYLGAISAHSDFTTIMRGSGTILHPVDPADDADADEVEREDGNDKESEELKDLVMDVVYAIADRSPKELLRPPLMTKLLSFHGASLSKFDRMLLSLFRKFEEDCGHSFAALAQQWTLPSSSQGGGSSVNTLDALQSLDSNVVFATCTEYPRSLSLGSNILSGYESDEEEGTEEVEEDNALPGQVYGKHTDPSQRYDPVFLSSLLAGVTDPSVKLSGLQWLAVFATNVPGLVVCGLSSRCADMRRASLVLVSNVYLALREADFQEKDHLIMVLDLLRDALDSSSTMQDDVATDAPFLPTTTTLFIAHSLRSVTTPGSFISPVISHFLLQRPELDIGDVPLLYNLLYTASDKYKQERMWILRFLRDVARSGGRSDWKIFKRRRTWELLASLYDAHDSNSTGSSERAVEEAAIRALIEDTTSWLVSNGDVAIELVTRRGLLTWVWQQMVREGVVAIANGTAGAGADKQAGVSDAGGSAVPPPRSVWMLLVAQLIRSVDLDRLHRATEGAWIASITTHVHITIKALHRCRSANARPSSLPSVSADLTRTVTYAAALVLDKMTSFAADDTALTLQAMTLVDALEMMLDLSADVLKAEQREKEKSQVERSCVRIQRSLLSLGAAAGLDDKTKQELAKLLRRSTAICQSFDPETSALVVSNLFTQSS